MNFIRLAPCSISNALSIIEFPEGCSLFEQHTVSKLFFKKSECLICIKNRVLNLNPVYVYILVRMGLISSLLDMSHGLELSLFTVCEHFFGKLLIMSGIAFKQNPTFYWIVSVYFEYLVCNKIQTLKQTWGLVWILFKSDFVPWRYLNTFMFIIKLVFPCSFVDFVYKQQYTINCFTIQKIIRD